MDDKYFLMIVTALVGVWLAMAIGDWGRRLYQWYQHKRAVQDIIDTGSVPADYGVVKREQARLNRIDEANTDPMHLGTSAERRGISLVREKVSHIRFAGYKIGEQDQRDKIAFDIGVRGSPFKRGSGEAKQWVRGYCMGRNVTDIKQYYDDA